MVGLISGKMRPMESQKHKAFEPRPSERITICWIIAIAAVAIFGPAWVSVLMFAVVVGGQPTAHAMARRLGPADRD